ncbi:MAG: DUF5672 family protein [Phycisphaerales bacterium]|nr:DUF5672 family protein [Phycisphaerales bacterium]
MSLVKIVIPIYKSQFNEYEKIALNRCVHLLGDQYPISFVCPKEIALEPLRKEWPIIGIDFFSDKYFGTLQRYNGLLMSQEFYSRFLDFEYILIYQTDAYLFKDDLSYWCAQNYDYIGAPWGPFNPHIKDMFHTIFKWVPGMQEQDFIYCKGLSQLALKTAQCLPRFLGGYNYVQTYNRVGNGGFSLRRVEKYVSLIPKYEKKIHYYYENFKEKRKRCSLPFAEDNFWCLEVNRYKERLRIPPMSIACKFAIESLVGAQLIQKPIDLPFGCHAWHKKGVINPLLAKWIL